MKKFCLNILGTPFTYEDEIEDISVKTNSPITVEEGLDLLCKTKELFSSINLDFYLAYGTLLGAIREKTIIPGDEDVDVFIDDESKLYNNLPYLYSNNYKVCRIMPGKLYSFRVNENAYIDVYILRPFKHAIWKYYCYSLSNHATPKKYFKEYQDIQFLGETFRCPKNPEKLIEFWYGKDWMNPKPGKKYFYEVPSAHYWHKFRYKISPLIKKIIGWNFWHK